MRWLRCVLDIDALKLVYFAYFQSVVKYGIVFWGNAYNLNKEFFTAKQDSEDNVGIELQKFL
jgi:hypothetical protein